MNRRLKKAHQKGRKARTAGEPLSANPYTREDYQRAWDDGWLEADVATEGTVTDGPPTVVVAQDPPVQTQTLGAAPSAQTQTYYYRNPPIPCPECQAVKAAPPIEHRQAVVAVKSNRWQAFMRCRVCKYNFILPVKYPPHG